MTRALAGKRAPARRRLPPFPALSGAAQEVSTFRPAGGQPNLQNCLWPQAQRGRGRFFAAVGGGRVLFRWRGKFAAHGSESGRKGNPGCPGGRPQERRFSPRAGSSRAATGKERFAQGAAWTGRRSKIDAAGGPCRGDTGRACPSSPAQKEPLRRSKTEARQFCPKPCAPPSASPARCPAAKGKRRPAGTSPAGRAVA